MNFARKPLDLKLCISSPPTTGHSKSRSSAARMKTVPVVEATTPLRCVSEASRVSLLGKKQHRFVPITMGPTSHLIVHSIVQTPGPILFFGRWRDTSGKRGTLDRCGCPASATQS
jgi:hypothetical protein